MLNRPMLSVVISPTVNVRSLPRLRAASLGRKFSCSAAASTRSRVSCRSWPRLLRGLDAAPTETPASAATFRIVTGRALGWFMDRPPFRCIVPGPGTQSGPLALDPGSGRALHSANYGIRFPLVSDDESDHEAECLWARAIARVRGGGARRVPPR